MKLRIMGTSSDNEHFISKLKTISGIDIISTSKEYSNRGNSKESRVYIELAINIVYSPAELVEPELIDINKL